MSKRINTKKCSCGCGQANGGRLRKLECVDCGWITYTSRTRIHEGLPTCHCGGSIEPPCLQDRVAVDGPVGDEAWAEMAGREAFSAVQSDRGRKGAQMAKIARAVKQGQANRTAMLAGADIPF